MAEVQEIPLDVETPSLDQVSAEAPEDAEAPKASTEAPKAKAKPKGRPKGARDKAPRQVAPKRSAKQTAKPTREISYSSPSSSEDSLDDRMVEQATLLHVLRDMQRYQSSRLSQKQQTYASWFGR